MKKSNKILFGIFLLIIIVLVAINIIFRYQVKIKQSTTLPATSPVVKPDTSSRTDSLEMENAIRNE